MATDIMNYEEDKKLADKIKRSIQEVVNLMNLAKQSKLIVNFNITEVDDMRTDSPSKLFMPLVTIHKEIN